jgi:hypothetical protein
LIETESPRIAGHTYFKSCVRLFVRLVLDAACSLRGASAAMRLIDARHSDGERTPTANTGQLWLLRLGLYELTRPKQRADDWVWILDHTVQIGVTKCLIIVAVRLSHWRQLGRPLQHRDLTMIALEPVEKSDGPTVAGQLEQAQERTGITPRAILSDEGTDLKGGIAAFCQANAGTAASLDIAHQAAKHLRRILESDRRWGEFFRRMGEAKQRLAQTPLAHLLPPTPRSKARYMNVRELVAWGRKALRYIDNPYPIADQPLDRHALRTKLGWLSGYRQALGEWRRLTSAVTTTLRYVRAHGYHRTAAGELRAALTPFTRSPASRDLARQLVEFVRMQSASVRKGEHLLGSSECLESLIGKGKSLERQQSKSGFTKMVLGMAAAVVQPTAGFVEQALSHIKTSQVTAWCNDHLGTSLQAKRRLALLPLGTEIR